MYLVGCLHYTSQWALNNTGQNGLADCDMDVQEAWSITTGRNVIKIAIIDKGVQLNHPDLVNNLHSGFDASGLGTNGGPIGNSGHGTCCAGIVGAQANNGIGVAGVAHNCSLIPITLDYDNIVNQEVADALNWAWDYGQADVISNSWSGIAQSSIIDAAISNAVSQGRSGLGSVVVWSAGNDSQSPVNYPASNSNVIAVGAMTSSNVRASYSNFGSEIDVVAPGNAIYSTDLTGSSGYNAGDYFDNFDGTSAAAPNVAGIVALILSVNRCLNSTDTRQILELSCDKVGAYCYQPTSGYNNGTWNNEMGYGKVNAYNAVRLASSNLITTVSNVTGSDQGAITCGGNFCSWVLAAGGCSGLAAATYLVNRHNISVNISYSNTPGATIVGFANGFSDSNPNNGNFNMQVSNITSTSATLTTNVYETFTILGQSTGWVPRAPTYVRFWYSVLGHLEESKYLQNENVFGLETHQSLININAGFNVTSAVPNGDYIVQNGANITFHSGGEVNLEPGFEVLYGGEFFATVNPFFTCAEYPYGKHANFSSSYFIDSSVYFNLLDSNKIKSDYIISNHPNPFTSETTIQFEMDRNDIFSLTIFDVFGNEIQNFKSSTSNENKVFKIEFSAANLPNGIYIYSLKTKDFIKTGKMLKL